MRLSLETALQAMVGVTSVGLVWGGILQEEDWIQQVIKGFGCRALDRLLKSLTATLHITLHITLYASLIRPDPFLHSPGLSSLVVTPEADEATASPSEGKDPSGPHFEPLVRPAQAPRNQEENPVYGWHNKFVEVTSMNPLPWNVKHCSP